MNDPEIVFDVIDCGGRGFLDIRSDLSRNETTEIRTLAKFILREAVE